MLPRPRWSSEVIPIDRGSKVIYKKKLWFWWWKKKFRRKNDGWQDEEEAHKDGGNVIYRDGIGAWEVSQSKGRRKLGWVAKISDRRLTMT